MTTIPASTSTPIAIAIPESDIRFDDDAHEVHEQERHQHRQRQRDRDDQDRAEMREEDDVGERDEDQLLDQRAFERAGGPIDQLRAVVKRNERNARRQARLSAPRSFA